MVEALVWVGPVFLAGSLLILERRCLGQMAVVQPLVVCLIAGWVTDTTETAIWIGVTLQLFSVSEIRRVDWALAGVVAAVSLVVAWRIGLLLSPNRPEAVALMIVATLVGVGSRYLDRRYARVDGERLKAHSPWETADPAGRVETLVRKRLLRWFVVGGLQVTVGTGACLAVLVGTRHLAGETPQETQVFAALVPAIGTAVAVGALAQRRFVILAGVSTAISCVVLL
ncbi:MAG: hypothetical protein QNJ97_00900 [Myxococcota bacterium]|nr:hypothetical protein [Myxococcota bacterium]